MSFCTGSCRLSVIDAPVVDYGTRSEQARRWRFNQTAARQSTRRNPSNNIWNFMECIMRLKILAGAAAVALTATTVLATSAPASAQRWDRGWGWGPAVAAGVVGGAVAAATA